MGKVRNMQEEKERREQSQWRKLQIRCFNNKAKLVKIAHVDICLCTLESSLYDTRLVGSTDTYGTTVLRLECLIQKWTAQRSWH